MTYVKTDIPKASGNPGTGGNKKDQIILMALQDILNFPERDSKGVVITGDFVMKPGCYAVRIYATKESIKAGSTSEGDTDAEGFNHNLEFEHPGNSTDIREFKTHWLSQDIIALVEHCSNGKKDLLGTLCAPLRLSTKWEDDKDKNKSTITLKSSQKSEFEVADYRGSLTFDSVTGTVPADDTSPDVSAGQGRYQLSDGTSASAEITTLDNPVNGGVYTLLGSGGSHPSTIPSGNDFVLASGTTWTALANSQITFKAFKDGASTFKFIEQSRL
jgi:hypothetical protein